MTGAVPDVAWQQWDVEGLYLAGFVQNVVQDGGPEGSRVG